MLYLFRVGFSFLCWGLRRWLGFFRSDSSCLWGNLKGNLYEGTSEQKQGGRRRERWAFGSVERKGGSALLPPLPLAFKVDICRPGLQTARRRCGPGLTNACFGFFSSQCLFWRELAAAGKSIILLQLSAIAIVFGFHGEVQTAFPVRFVRYNPTAAFVFKPKFLRCNASDTPDWTFFGLVRAFLFPLCRNVPFILNCVLKSLRHPAGMFVM